MKRIVLVVAGILILCAGAYSVWSKPFSGAVGYAVEISPDTELQGFFEARITRFDLESDAPLGDKTLTFDTGGSRYIVFRETERLTTEITVAVSDDGAAATYAVTTKDDDRVVASTLATVNLGPRPSPR